MVKTSSSKNAYSMGADALIVSLASFIVVFVISLLFMCSLGFCNDKMKDADNEDNKENSEQLSLNEGGIEQLSLNEGGIEQLSLNEGGIEQFGSYKMEKLRLNY